VSLIVRWNPKRGEPESEPGSPAQWEQHARYGRVVAVQPGIAWQNPAADSEAMKMQTNINVNEPGNRPRDRQAGRPVDTGDLMLTLSD
jgi:hypothetical protein